MSHCPEPGHADGRLQSRGTRVTKAGTWHRFRCLRPDGSHHQFQVLTDADGSVLHSMHRPPACPEHEGSRVTRHGAYGTGAKRRQRYRCQPRDGLGAHTFTPSLTREVVAVGTQACATCDELLSPHRGALTGARHTPWSLSLYARALNELSLGASYSSTSLMMRSYRDRARRHLHEEHGLDLDAAAAAPVPVADAGLSLTPQGGGRGNVAWHLAANVVEQYAPLVWREVEARIRAREAMQRAANDEHLASRPAERLDTPVTWLLDEHHVNVASRRASDGRRRRRTWFILVVVEVHWHPPAAGMDLPRREYRLRLARAYPRGNAQAWRLVFHELGVRPDFVIADHGAAIASALESEFGAGVGFIPSLFHMRRRLRETLTDLPGATTKRHGRRVLVDAVAGKLDVLTREDLLTGGAAAWATWWDELEAAVTALPAPVLGLLEQRKLYEPKVAAALPLLHVYPHLPASNAAVENNIRHQLEPFLENRKQGYRNLARLNYLLDLAVARSQGAFTDLEAIAHLIRLDNEQAGGWAYAPRALADTQPPPSAPDRTPARYASLFNTLLVGALVEQRLGTPSGTTTAEAGLDTLGLRASSSASSSSTAGSSTGSGPRPSEAR